MKYFRPDIELGTVLPPQTRPEEKLGGLPWGLPMTLWPMCATCKKPQTLLAEFRHAPRRLDLGAAGRVLFVFHCANDPGLCEDWSQDSGGNAAFVLDATALTSGLTSPPAEVPSYPEVRILSWSEFDDAIPLEAVPSFFSEDLFLTVDPSVISSITTGTRLGGVPSWIQSPDEAPQGYRFLGQLDSTYSFYGAFPSADARKGLRSGLDESAFEGRTWWAEGPNFGDAGIGYLFLRDSEGVPEVKFFWQCG